MCVSLPDCVPHDASYMHVHWICAIFLSHVSPQLLVYLLLFDLQRQHQVEVSVESLFEVEFARERKLEQVLGAQFLLSADMVGGFMLCLVAGVEHQQHRGGAPLPGTCVPPHHRTACHHFRPQPATAAPLARHNQKGTCHPTSA